MSFNVGASGVSANVPVNTTNAQQPANNQVNQAAEEKKSNDTPAAVYEKSDSKVSYKPDTKTMEKIKADVLRQTESLRNLVSSLFEKQGNSWNNAYGYLNIDDATRAEAQKLVADDGYFGVEQTANRLVDFAKAVSGGDPAKLEEMRKAVQDGFKSAEEIWGGELPEISQKTYDRTMELFDQWAEESEKTAMPTM